MLRSASFVAPALLFAAYLCDRLELISESLRADWCWEWVVLLMLDIGIAPRDLYTIYDGFVLRTGQRWSTAAHRPHIMRPLLHVLERWWTSMEHVGDRRQSMFQQQRRRIHRYVTALEQCGGENEEVAELIGQFELLSRRMAGRSA